MTDLQDTIVALSTAPGPGARAIVRLTGPNAVPIAIQVIGTETTVQRAERRRYEGQAKLPGLAAPLKAALFVCPGPRTYTGQDLVEAHTISCPPLVELLVAEFLTAGARAAQAGDFTLRAFLAGKLDLPKAEAVLGVIDAGNRDELRHALAQLAGGASGPLTELRSDLLNLLADVEAGLDFAEEDIQFTDRRTLLGRLAEGMARVTIVQKQLDRRSLAERPFRVVLTGRPNVGKSSLFNALTGNATALVSPRPGTTRDYLVARVEWHRVALELVDTAGLCEAEDKIEGRAQTLGKTQAEQADLVLICAEAGAAVGDVHLAGDASSRVFVTTKTDLFEDRAFSEEARGSVLLTSATTGAGLDELRFFLAERARARRVSPLAPSLSRCRHHIQACLDHLRQAHSITLYEEPPELLALELRGALNQLGEMVGAVYTDDLLDRIFSRFCIGK